MLNGLSWIGNEILSLETRSSLARNRFLNWSLYGNVERKTWKEREKRIWNEMLNHTEKRLESVWDFAWWSIIRIILLEQPTNQKEPYLNSICVMLAFEIYASIPSNIAITKLMDSQSHVYHQFQSMRYQRENPANKVTTKVNPPLGLMVSSKVQQHVAENTTRTWF